METDGRGLKRPQPQKPLYMRVVEHIQQSIDAGELLPGDQLLPERELAERLAVSRTSVRQALAILDGMGLIGITPRSGAYVKKRNLEDVLATLVQVLFQDRGQVAYLFEVRRILETQAACLAAERCVEGDIQHLRALNRQFEAGLNNTDLAFQANMRFHIAIVEAAKNPLLSEIASTLLTAMLEVYAKARRRSLGQIARLEKFVDEHEQIIDAIAHQKPQLAADLLAQHIDDARRRVEIIVEEELKKGG